MLSQEQKSKFEREGFLHLKGIFTPTEAEKLRKDTERIFEPDNKYPGDLDFGPSRLSSRNDLLNRYPEFLWLMEHTKFISSLKSLLGDDFVFLPEMAAQASGYAGWHKDTTAQETAGKSFHWQKNYLMIEAGIYLQDNSELGGGLDVISGSHLEPDQHIPKPKDIFINRFKRKILNFFSKKPEVYSIPSKLGDVVLFHFRIDHRATQPRTKKQSKVRKLALFFACSANNEHVKSYIDFIRSRPDYIYLKDLKYSDEILELSKQNELTLVS